jgi:hypothetical protein
LRPAAQVNLFDEGGFEAELMPSTIYINPRGPVKPLASCPLRKIIAKPAPSRKAFSAVLGIFSPLFPH